MELHERLAHSAAGEISQPPGDPFAELKDRIHVELIDDLGRQLFASDFQRTGLAANVTGVVRERLEQEPGISREDRERLVGELSDDIMGHGPLERLLADDSVSEIMVNGPHDVWIEREGRLHRTTARFTDESHLRRIINKMVAEVGRRVDETQPMVDARLPDGSRINAIIPPLSLSGALLTIRKFGSERLNLDDLIRLGTLSPETIDLLRRCVEARLNVLISGGTGSGKTTLLNALSAAIADSERIVTIEDAAELQMKQNHVLRLESRPKNIEGQGEITIRALVRNALRMRPDRIIVGEVRGAEALDMLQAMNTGHAGRAGRVPEATRVRRLLALPLAALAVAMACAAAATAGTSPRITEARAPFPQRAFVLSLPTAMRLSAGQVRVLENGKPVSGVNVIPAGGSAEQFGVVLLIDASNSMRGEAIDGAMAAARAFATKRTKLEQLAVVAF